MFQKTSTEKKSQENPYLTIQNTKLTIHSNRPTWQFKLLWKQNTTGILTIQDLNSNTTVLNQEIKEHKTYLLGTGLNPKDSKNSWMFQSDRVEEIKMEVVFQDGSGREFKSPFSTIVSRETKHSLNLKFKNP